MADSARLKALLEGNSRREFVNAQSSTGATALYAVIDTLKKNYPERTLKVIELLVEHGADHNIGAKSISPVRGQLVTPREYAMSLGLLDIVAYFDEVENKNGMV
jgi:hypothetical protein